MKTILYILISLTLFSCVTEKKCSQKFPPQVITKDSISYIEKVRDSIVKTPPDSAKIKALLKCDSLGNVYIQTIEELKLGNKVKPSIKIKDNYIYLDCLVDSGQVYLAWKEKFYSQNSSKIEQKPPVKVNYLTGFQWFQIYTARILLAILLLIIIYLYIKFKLKPLILSKRFQ